MVQCYELKLDYMTTKCATTGLNESYLSSTYWEVGQTLTLVASVASVAIYGFKLRKYFLNQLRKKITANNEMTNLRMGNEHIY